LGFLIVYRAIHSPFGQVLKAIRENEPRATSLGYRAEHYKLIVFALSATLSGLAGATKAIVFQLASLTDVHWTMSGEVVLMTLLGGLGTVFGPVVGAFIMIGLENYLATLGAWVTIVQGVIFVVCVLIFRRGVVVERERCVLSHVPAGAERSFQHPGDLRDRRSVQAALRLADDEETVEELEPLAGEHSEVHEPLVFDPSPAPGLELWLDHRAHGARLRARARTGQRGGLDTAPLHRGV